MSPKTASCAVTMFPSTSQILFPRSGFLMRSPGSTYLFEAPKSSHLNTIDFRILAWRSASRHTSTMSTVGRGRLYEYSCREFLQSQLSMQLVICGGAGDQGVDLRGHWTLDKPRDVLVQCKHYKQRLGPAAVREMEGTASYYTSETTLPLLSVICARSGFTTSSWKRALASSKPLLLLHLDFKAEDTQLSDEALPLECRGAWYNSAFERIAGGHFSTETIHTPSAVASVRTLIRLSKKANT